MTDAPAVSPPELRRTARRGLTIYFAIVVVLSGGLEAYIWMNPSTLGTLVLPLMWTPALASVIARLILREGFSDVSFRFGGLRTWRWYAVGLAMPLVVGVVAYSVAWLTGLVGFQGDTTTVLRGVAYAATAETLVNLLSTTGEEVGWRGYMLTRLIDAGTPRPVLVGGLAPSADLRRRLCGRLQPRALGRAVRRVGRVDLVRVLPNAARDRERLAGGLRPRHLERHHPRPVRRRLDRTRRGALDRRVRHPRRGRPRRVRRLRLARAMDLHPPSAGGWRAALTGRLDVAGAADPALRSG